MKDTDCSAYEEADGDCLTNACSGCCVKYRAELESLRLALETAERERGEIAVCADGWMKRTVAAERERDEARAAALVAVEERRSFQKAHDLSERHRGPLERVRSAAYDLFQALDWEAPGWRDETCAERGDATNKAWFELEAALNFAAECDSSLSRPAPHAAPLDHVAFLTGLPVELNSLLPEGSIFMHPRTFNGLPAEHPSWLDRMRAEAKKVTSALDGDGRDGFNGSGPFEE